MPARTRLSVEIANSRTGRECHSDPSLPNAHGVPPWTPLQTQADNRKSAVDVFGKINGSKRQRHARDFGADCDKAVLQGNILSLSVRLLTL